MGLKTVYDTATALELAREEWRDKPRVLPVLPGRHARLGGVRWRSRRLRCCARFVNCAGESIC